MKQALTSTNRKSCYQILAALFNYPEQTLVTNLARDLSELSTLLNLPLPSELTQAVPVTELEVAYTGLFINRLGGAPAPPYGSIYLEADAQLMGASCVRVAQYYQAEGLNSDASPEPADFLPTELEFLYYLVTEQEQADAASSDLQQKQADFCQELLHPWLGEFCRRIEAAEGGHPLYTWAAAALMRFTALEQDCFNNGADSNPALTGDIKSN